MIDERLLFNNILKRSDQELLQWLPGVIKRMGYSSFAIHQTEDYIFAVGNTSTLLIAHLDTYYDTYPQTMLSDKGILWSPEGIGANGRCGVYTALEVTKRMDIGKKPSLLFVTSKSTRKKGPKGLYRFMAEFPNRHFKVTHALELNQKGYKEFVVYEPESSAFTQAVADQTGFVPLQGERPVTNYLGQVWQIPVCSIPMGYKIGGGGEYIVKNHLSNAITQVTALLKSGALQTDLYDLKPRTQTKVERCRQCQVLLLDEEVEQGFGLCFDCLSDDY